MDEALPSGAVNIAYRDYHPHWPDALDQWLWQIGGLVRSQCRDSERRFYAPRVMSKYPVSC